MCAAARATPQAAMVLAAGLGTRLRPLTDRIPKPLIEVGGQPAIFHALQAVAEAGVPRAVINTHYHAAVLEQAVRAAHAAGRFGALEIRFSYEMDLLETGGGLKAALPLLEVAPGAPLLTLNSDAIWQEAQAPLLRPLLAAWARQPAPVQALLAVLPQARTVAFQPKADFLLRPDGTLSRDGERPTFTHVYGGVQVLETTKVAAFGMSRFSLNLIWEAMRAEGGLHGYVYDAPWADMGTPEGLQVARRLVALVPHA